MLERLESRCLLATDFTIAMIPDTQHYLEEDVPETFDAQTQWIVDHLETENIAFVTHVGDLVEHPGDPFEWALVDASMDTLDGDLGANPDGLVPLFNVAR